MATSTLRLPPLPTIREIIRLYKLTALRKLSQNFLLDERVINKIVRNAGNITNGYVCEVGPGPGGITRAILKRNPKHVVVIEKDKRFLPSLEMLAEACNGHLDIIFGDVLTYNMEKSFPEEYRNAWDDKPPNIHLIGNLPFNVATPLIIKWLHAISLRQNAWSYGRTKLTLTFQKEVAERMVADIGSDQRCRLSIMCQNWCHVKHKFTISGSSFLPKPDVDVGVVHFVPRIEPIIPFPFEMVEKVVQHIFHGRQKYCIRGIELLFPFQTREEYGKQMCELAKISPKIQPYKITLDEFGRLCEAYKQICDNQPSLYKYSYRNQKNNVLTDTSENEYGDNNWLQEVSSQSR